MRLLLREQLDTASKKEGDPEGGIRIALGAAGKSCF